MNANLSILVVDDEQSNIAIVMDSLQSVGFSVSFATDGFKAIAACKVRMPDLILLDLQMPLISGVDVFKRLRSDEKTREIPIVFMRRKGEHPAELAGSEYWVISKPIVPEELVSRVRTALSEQSLKAEIKQKEVELRELALTDPLTSFRSVRYLAEFLKAEINQCRRYKTPLSFVLVEVDKYRDLFKSLGPAGYNSLVSQVATFIGQQSRQSDIIVRMSESELGLFLTYTDLKGAVELAERLREAIAEHQFKFLDRGFTTTVSIGVSLLVEGMDDDGQMLISYARSAVDQAKAAGGNMTLIAE